MPQLSRDVKLARQPEVPVPKKVSSKVLFVVIEMSGVETDVVSSQS